METPRPSANPFLTDSILPPPPDGAVPVLHNREYRVESYYLGDDRILIQGALRDQKAPDLFIPGDPDPLTMHHMIVGLEITLPAMTIEAVHTHFEHHPHDSCPTIIEHYDLLVGLSITRGFTHKIRELFGGPRGCSHTTALLQAMAPVAMQSLKGVECVEAMAADHPHPIIDRPPSDNWSRLVNTCHVWAEGSDRAAEVARGGVQTIPVQLRLDRLAAGRET